ncbi:hypothetical protein VUR80DRAFT_392 [Thermomyces stellatus]
MFVGLRFYTRGLMLRRLGLSDWLILLSLVSSVTACEVHIPTCANIAPVPCHWLDVRHDSDGRVRSRKTQDLYLTKQIHEIP